MCGILGFSGFNGSLNLSDSLSKLGHRGPDDSGIFENKSCEIGLAHARLSILDLSSLGHQPMVDESDEVVIVFNGEIYNFRELRTELEADGLSFRSQSDTEVLLKLYLVHGEKMLPLLNGIFAFAVWDGRRKRLFIARDALGVKPLYYSFGDSGFTFASEIKALPNLGAISKDLDHAALHRYLTFLWCPGERTPLKSVKKLGPGKAMWVRNGKLERSFTWYRLPGRSIQPSTLNKNESIVGTAAHLREAVHRQMVADVPVGAFLSGGLDSSSVVAFARELNPNIHCFTIEAEGGQEAGVADDLPYAKKVASYLNVPLEIVRIDSSRMAQDLETMVAQLDEPLADPAPLNVLYISRLARENNIKVLLSGAGGDDFFTGYRRHHAVQLQRYWDWLPKPLLTGLEYGTSILDQRHTWSRRLSKLISGATLEGDARLINYFRWVQRDDLFELYTPAVYSDVFGRAF